MNTYTPDSTKIVHSIDVDFRRREIITPVHIVQGDISMPILAVSLYSDGQIYTIPANADMNIRVGKLDNTFVYNPALGCNADRNIVYFEITAQMAAVYGDTKAVAEVVIGGEVAASSYILLAIDRNPVQEGMIESTDEGQSIIAFMRRAETAANEAEQSEINSKASEEAAKTSEDNAKASEEAAKTSEDNALLSAMAADASAGEAKTSEDNAKASEEAAKESELAAAESAEQSEAYYRDLAIGARNLVLKSNRGWTSNETKIMNGDLSIPWENGRTYAISVKGTPTDANHSFEVFSDANGTNSVATLVYDESDGLYHAIVEAAGTDSGKVFSIFESPSDGAHNVSIEWIKMERGNKATDWLPAPEDNGGAGLGAQYILCDTARDVADKTIFIEDFKLVVGAHIFVKFTSESETNPASGAITLNVTDTGAKPVYFSGPNYGSVDFSNGYFFANDRCEEFLYDGERWLWLNFGYESKKQMKYSDYLQLSDDEKNSGKAFYVTDIGQDNAYLYDDGESLHVNDDASITNTRTAINLIKSEVNEIERKISSYETYTINTFDGNIISSGTLQVEKLNGWCHVTGTLTQNDTVIDAVDITTLPQPKNGHTVYIPNTYIRAAYNRNAHTRIMNNGNLRFQYGSADLTTYIDVTYSYEE